MKKKLFIFSIVIIMVFSTNIGSIQASAIEIDENQTYETTYPRFANVNQCTFTFQVLSPGEAHVGVTYAAKSDVFVHSKLTVKIQKKFLGLFWTTVNINEPNNEWVSTSDMVNGYFYNSFPVNGTGTYRALFTVEITGINGTIDTIENTIEFKYS